MMESGSRFDGRLSVVVATPPGLNPGMAASELALLAFAKRHGFLNVLSVYQLCSINERLVGIPGSEVEAVLARARLPIPYRSARDSYNELLTSEAVMFWGDFLHMAQYIRTLQGALCGLRGIPNSEAAFELVHRVLLLKDVPQDVLNRTISFGTTLLFNTQADENQGEYGALLKRFLTEIRRIWVRDTISAAKVAHVRNDYSTAYWGCDCAYLLKRDDLDAFTHLDDMEDLHDGSAVGCVRVFLGRTPEVGREMLDFAQAIAAQRGKECRWLPWGSGTAFPHSDWRQHDTVANQKSKGPHVVRLLRMAAKADLIVTDTYHLALIAWNFGVPAVLLASPYVAAKANVNSGAEFNWRDKREVLFSQYDALDFLIRPEEICHAERLSRRATHVLELLEDETHLQAIQEHMHGHADAIEQACASEVRGLLTGRHLSDRGRSN